MNEKKEKTREQILEEILENLIIAIKKAEMEAVARIKIDVFKTKQ